MSDFTSDSISLPRKSRPTYETEVVHPAVAQWLTEHGYAYEHEVRMPEFGRADFVATHPDGTVLVIECKAALRQSTGYHCVQVMDYCMQLDCGAKPALAVPQGTVTPKSRAIAQRRGILIIEVQVAAWRSKAAQLEETFAFYATEFALACYGLDLCLAQRATSAYFWEKAYNEAFDGGVRFVQKALPVSALEGLTYQKARTRIEQMLAQEWRCYSADELKVVSRFFEWIVDDIGITHYE